MLWYKVDFSLESCRRVVAQREVRQNNFIVEAFSSKKLSYESDQCQIPVMPASTFSELEVGNGELGDSGR